MTLAARTTSCRWCERSRAEEGEEGEEGEEEEEGEEGVDKLPALGASDTRSRIELRHPTFAPVSHDFFIFGLSAETNLVFLVFVDIFSFFSPFSRTFWLSSSMERLCSTRVKEPASKPKDSGQTVSALHTTVPGPAPKSNRVLGLNVGTLL
jgi:hypothetical protein